MIPPDSDIPGTLARIAAALERLGPPSVTDANPATGDAFVWTGAELRAATVSPVRPLSLLLGIDSQKAVLLANVERHAAGLPSHDVLLWGSRGMGKSALAKGVVADVRRRGIDFALIEVARADIGSLPALFRRLAGCNRRFLLFCDDLSFEADEHDYKALRSVLEGGIEERPENCRLIVTSNRRHLVPREHADADNAINARDVLDDRLALADRFGLSLGFHNCDQPTFLAMVRAYAVAFGLPFDEQAALTWATGRGSRSGRVAWQYTQDVAGRVGKTLA